MSTMTETKEARKTLSTADAAAMAGVTETDIVAALESGDLRGSKARGQWTVESAAVTPWQRARVAARLLTAEKVRAIEGQLPNAEYCESTECGGGECMSPVSGAGPWLVRGDGFDVDLVLHREVDSPIVQRAELVGVVVALLPDGDEGVDVTLTIAQFKRFMANAAEALDAAEKDDALLRSLVR